MARLVRTLIIAAAAVGLVLAAYWGFTDARHRRVERELRALNEALEAQLAERQEMVERLSRTSRLAHVEILDQRIGVDGEPMDTAVRFIEVDDEGTELARQDFLIPGDVLFVDAWTVKFGHADVAAAHPILGRSLVLLRRVYSDRMPPAEGFALDTPGAVPPGYAAGDRGRFEQRVWASFWDIATDPVLAAAMGVRVAQGEAVYKPVAAGQRYDLVVDADGGISLTPVDATADASTTAPIPVPPVAAGAAPGLADG